MHSEKPHAPEDHLQIQICETHFFPPCQRCQPDVRISQVFSDSNPLCSAVPLNKFHRVLDFFHWSASHPVSWPIIQQIYHTLLPPILMEANHLQGLHSEVQRNHSQSRKNVPSPGDCISLFTSDRRSGILTAQVTATMSGPHGTAIAEEESHRLGARRPGFESYHCLGALQQAVSNL